MLLWTTFRCTHFWYNIRHKMKYENCFIWTGNFSVLSLVSFRFVLMFRFSMCFAKENGMEWNGTVKAIAFGYQRQRWNIMLVKCFIYFGRKYLRNASQEHCGRFMIFHSSHLFRVVFWLGSFWLFFASVFERFFHINSKQWLMRVRIARNKKKK